MSLAIETSLQKRVYDRRGSIIFLKTKEKFGGLSNMAGGFPIRINGTRIATAEAFYQACRFPHHPEIQREIIAEASPMTAKMRGKPHRDLTRSDWETARVPIMRWTIRAKLAFNFYDFSRLLLETGEKPIVEESRRDPFWGAVPEGTEQLVGQNVLGRLLMELRQEVKNLPQDHFAYLPALTLRDFLLDGEAIEPVVTRRSRLF